MKKVFFILFVIVLYVSCNHKQKPIGTKKITKDLFLEVYQKSNGGVFASDVYTNYLTDSVSFRKFVGAEYDDERLLIKLLNSDLILVNKVDFHSNDTIDKKVYCLSQLKREGKFDK